MKICLVLKKLGGGKSVHLILKADTTQTTMDQTMIHNSQGKQEIDSSTDDEDREDGTRHADKRGLENRGVGHL